MEYCYSLHFISPSLLSKNKKGKKRKEKKRKENKRKEKKRKEKKNRGQLLFLRDNTGNNCSGKEERRTNLRQNQMTTATIMETDDRRDDMENRTADGETEVNPWPYIKDHFSYKSQKLIRPRC